MNFIEYVRQQIAWSQRTFGPGKRKKGVLDHIRKELKEIEDAPDGESELGEWIDVIILATDGAWRAGYSPEQIAVALFNKQTKNINRVWPDWRTMSEDQAIEHDRSVDFSGLREAAARSAQVGEQFERMKGRYFCPHCDALQDWPGFCENCRVTVVMEDPNYARPSQT